MRFAAQSTDDDIQSYYYFIYLLHWLHSFTKPKLYQSGSTRFTVADHIRVMKAFSKASTGPDTPRLLGTFQLNPFTSTNWCHIEAAFVSPYPWWSPCAYSIYRCVDDALWLDAPFGQQETAHSSSRATETRSQIAHACTHKIRRMKHLYE